MARILWKPPYGTRFRMLRRYRRRPDAAIHRIRVSTKEVHGSCVQVDPAIESMLMRVEAH